MHLSAFGLTCLQGAETMLRFEPPPLVNMSTSHQRA
ncbi:unnamed protein product [Arabidopsis halleri]